MTCSTQTMKTPCSNSCTITCPLKLETPRGHVYNLNFNNFHRWGMMERYRVKNLFNLEVGPQLIKPPRIHIADKYEIQYVLYVPDRRRRDLANACCIVGKYFEDLLQTKGITKDDSCVYLPKITYSYGGVDVDNPRIEATIIWSNE